MKQLQKHFRLVTVSVLVGMLAPYLWITLQEQNIENKVQQWKVPLSNSSDLIIIDREGVCVYTIEASSNKGVAISVISKAVLPTGKGC